MARICLVLLILGLATAASAQSEDGLFPAPQNPKTGFLKVSDLHRIHYICCGNPEGRPVMCLHGGPGSGAYPRLARYFNPAKFRIVLHDQRGAGRSTPVGELRENTTWHLVEDIEKLRRHLGLGKVMIYGGSWGSTLALAYATQYPQNVTGMLMRGIFLGSEEELEFHYLHTGFLFPKEHDALLQLLPDKSRGTHPDYLWELIRGDDKELSRKILDRLARFELKFMKLNMKDETIDGILKRNSPEERIRYASIDMHYVTNRYFMKPGHILGNIGVLKGIPVTLINGRYDMASPPRAAYQVHQALPDSKLIIVPAAGHSESEPGITAAIVKAAAEFEPK